MLELPVRAGPRGAPGGPMGSRGGVITPAESEILHDEASPGKPELAK